MKILSITTTHRTCGCAVCDDGRALAETLFDGYRSCAEELAPRVEETLRRAGLGVEALEGVAVDIGPGGLTGLKIGVVSAKTLAQIRGLPLAGVPSFEILAAGAPPEFSRAAVVIHSSRDDFYYALLSRAGEGFEAAAPAVCIRREEIERESVSWDSSTWVTGGGVGKFEWEAGAFTLAPPDRRFPRPSDACRVAAALFRAGRGARYDEVSPLYVSLTNAEKTKKQVEVEV